MLFQGWLMASLLFLWLVESYHVIRILASVWSKMIDGFANMSRHPRLCPVWHLKQRLGWPQGGTFSCKFRNMLKNFHAQVKVLSPKTKSKIQVQGLKFKKRDWDWGGHYDPTGHPPPITFLTWNVNLVMGKDHPWPSLTSLDLPWPPVTFHDLLWPSMTFYHLL